MMRSLFILPISTALLIGVLAADAQAANLKKALCSGEFGTGSGMAGSYVGDNCFLAADSDVERQVQNICAQNSKCEVTGMVTAVENSNLQIQSVLSVVQVERPANAR
jgi:hypothetical protein